MKRRNWIALGIGTVAVVTVLLARRPLQQWATLTSVTRSNNPSETVMNELLEGSTDRAAMLISLWSAGGVVRQAFVVNSLRRFEASSPKDWERVRPIVIAASRSADADIQQASLAVLEKHSDQHATSVALRFLWDADSELRSSGIRFIASLQDKRFVPVLMRHVDDSDPFVLSMTFAALRDLTGREGTWTYNGDENINRQAIEDWKSWWKAHAEQHPNTEWPEMAAESRELLEAPGSTLPLRDLDGRQHQLLDHRGKIVLLNFWATWCPSCVAELPALIELQRRHPADLVLLGISVDALHDHEHDHGDESHDSNGAKEDLHEKQVIEKVRAFSSKHGMNYRVLLDHPGEMTATYDASGVPVTVLIDQEGRMARRFVGSRSLEVLERMIAELRSNAVN